MIKGKTFTIKKSNGAKNLAEILDSSFVVKRLKVYNVSSDTLVGGPNVSQGNGFMLGGTQHYDFEFDAEDDAIDKFYFRTLSETEITISIFVS